MKINDDETEQSISNDRSMKIHKKSIRSIGLTPDGESLLTVSKDKSIKIRSTETGQIIHKYERAHEYLHFFEREKKKESSMNCLVHQSIVYVLLIIVY